MPKDLGSVSSCLKKMHHEPWAVLSGVLCGKRSMMTSASMES